ncbi:MAG: DUF4097 family beta strand repeat-containing protein [Opitutaceae bacterium]
MKSIAIGFVAFVRCSSLLPLRAEWQHQVQLSGDPAGGRLTISGLHGDLTIEGVDGSELTISSPDIEAPEEPRQEASGEPNTGGLRSLLAGASDNSGLGLQVSVEGASVSIVAVRPRESAEFHLKIPRAMGLHVQGLLEGDVTVKNIQGDIEIAATNGDVEVQGATSPVVIHSVSGDVDLAFEAFPDTRPTSINAVDGDAQVELPVDATVDLELRTLNGDIFTDLPVEVKDRRVVDWGGPKTVSAVLNGGGGKLAINAINGDVIVRGPKSQE